MKKLVVAFIISILALVACSNGRKELDYTSSTREYDRNIAVVVTTAANESSEASSVAGEVSTSAPETLLSEHDMYATEVEESTEPSIEEIRLADEYSYPTDSDELNTEDTFIDLGNFDEITWDTTFAIKCSTGVTGVKLSKTNILHGQDALEKIYQYNTQVSLRYLTDCDTDWENVLIPFQFDYAIAFDSSDKKIEPVFTVNSLGNAGGIVYKDDYYTVDPILLYAERRKDGRKGYIAIKVPSSDWKDYTLVVSGAENSISIPLKQ